MAAHVLHSYTALSPSSTGLEVSNSLQAIIEAPPFTIDTSSRTELIKCLLRDLQAISNLGHRTLSPKEAAQALLAVKTLGKHPSGSEYLATAENLSILLALASSFKDDLEASSEALRCIANALLLIEAGRSTFLQKDVNGGVIATTMFQKASNPDQIFILARILFLCTASGPSFIRDFVENEFDGHAGVEIITSKLDVLIIGILAGARMTREAMSDSLKFAFNILLHYPKMVESEPQNAEANDPRERKIVGDFWSSKLDSILPPLLRVFTSLPPTFPAPVTAPLTHALHALIAIPINSSELRPIWLGTVTPHQPAAANLKDSPGSPTPQHIATSSSSSRSDSPSRSTVTSPSPISPKPSTLDRASSLIAAGRRSLSKSPSNNTPVQTNALQHACNLLEVAFAHYFPGTVDPDDQEVQDRCKQESPDNSLDDLLPPLVVLISRFCIDDTSRAFIRQWIVPDDLDRSKSLESRADILGRCLRLMQSVYHPRLKDAVGEFLYAMSESDASILSSLLGYGNVAGFLANKGIFSAPPPPNKSSNSYVPPTTTSSGAVINPITGTTITSDTTQGLPEMTDEEKELEIEKLFVLFDRLEKSGAIPASQNPMRKAMQEGKL